MKRDEKIDEREFEIEGGPVLLHEELGVCPVCGNNSFKFKIYLYTIYNYGKVIITTGECSKCGYRIRDVKLAELTKPKKIIVHVNGEKQLRYILVKSAYAVVLIPERGYEMIPGPASTGFITTIEGLLFRFKEALEIGCKNKDNKCNIEKDWINKAIKGKEKFTIIICDYEGASKVFAAENVEETNIDELCLEKKPEWLEYL